MRTLRRLFRKLKRRGKRLLLKYGIIPPMDEMYADLNYIYHEPVLHEVTAEVTIFLSGDDVDEIVSLALVGITHWCKEAVAVGFYPGKLVSQQLSRRGTLLLRDASNNVHELTLPKLLDGFRLYFANGGNVDHNERGRIDIRDIDRTAADAIVQYALFQKIIYERE